VLNLPGFYFSTTLDVTLSQLRCALLVGATTRQPFNLSFIRAICFFKGYTETLTFQQRLERSDSRFFWNRYLLQSFLEHTTVRQGEGRNCHRLWEGYAVLLPSFRDGNSRPLLCRLQAVAVATPMTLGFMRSFDVLLSTGHACTYALFSRRAVGRAGKPGMGCFLSWASSGKRIHRKVSLGVRFHCRGVDPTGHCANYIETEQLLLLNDTVAIHTQVGGWMLCPRDRQENKIFHLSAWVSPN
jgi:hypothetical protein